MPGLLSKIAKIALFQGPDCPGPQYFTCTNFAGGKKCNVSGVNSGAIEIYGFGVGVNSRVAGFCVWCSNNLNCGFCFDVYAVVITDCYGYYYEYAGYLCCGANCSNPCAPSCGCS